jgi:hypothetical protein
VNQRGDVSTPGRADTVRDGRADRDACDSCAA